MQECECLHHEGFCLVESVKEEISIQYKKKVMFSLGKYLINFTFSKCWKQERKK